MNIKTKTLAIGIYTYRHPEAIEDVLAVAAGYLYNHHIDVYYYDGSSDTKTKEVIEAYRSRGFTNLYHLHFPESTQRAKMVFQGVGMQKDYDYIWPGKDRIVFTEEVITAVLNALEEDPDVICLSQNPALHGIQKQYYHDPVLYYRDHGWISTSIDTVIYQKKSMLRDFTEWIYPHDIFNPYYSHLFHTLAHKETVRICVLTGDHINTYNSPKAVSSWIHKAFKTWKDDWIKVNELLPECYEPYKAKVIKETATKPWLLGDIDRLMELHEKGILTPEKLPQIEPDWERVSNVPFEVVRDIALDQYDPAHDMRMIVSRSEFLDLLVSVRNMLKSGQINAEQIPWKAIRVYLYNKLLALKTDRRTDIFLITGTIDDLENLSKEDGDHTERCIIYLQIIIDFLLLIEEDKAGQ